MNTQQQDEQAVRSHQYRYESDADLLFIIKDAGEAALSMRRIRELEAEHECLDQVADACAELLRRR